MRVPPLSRLDGATPRPQIRTGWGTQPLRQDWIRVPPPPSGDRVAKRRVVCLLRSRRMTFLQLLYLHQGLVETVHPYTFVARQGFKELFETEQSADKVIPLLSKTTPHIRAALVSFIQTHAFSAFHFLYFQRSFFAHQFPKLLGTFFYHVDDVAFSKVWPKSYRIDGAFWYFFFKLHVGGPKGLTLFVQRILYPPRHKNTFLFISLMLLLF